jgi:transcription-repair coupling factor (superfamily II helicase)
VPHEADELMHVVGLRRVGTKLGCEKIILKQGYMQMQFVSNVNSPFYRSQMFNRMTALWSRNDTLGLSEEHTRLE